MGCLKLTYHLSAAPLLRCAYNAANGAGARAVAPVTTYSTQNGITQKLIYLPGGGIYVKQSGQSDKIYYTHKDHPGSIIKITDDNGTAVFSATYDAWGKQTVTTNTFKFHRGYTGHEHLPEFGLINMNGRMYDPIVGRFLSPDPFVQAPDFSQSYNRYSYCLNNPLIYTDPSGEIIFTLLSAIFCPALLPAAFNLDMSWMQGGFTEMANGGKFWSGAGKGFVVGLANAGLSFLNIPGAIPNGLLHAGGNVMINGISNSLNGQDFFKGWYLPAASGALSGGYSGFKMANEMGLNPLTGGLNPSVRLNDKLNYFLDQNDAELRSLFGDELIDKTNVKGGLLIGADGKTVPTGSNGIEGVYGFEGEYSKIKLSRRVVNLYYQTQDIRAKGVLFHEYFHSGDYYSGLDRYICATFGDAGASIILEAITYQRVYDMFETQSWGYSYFSDLLYKFLYK